MKGTWNCSYKLLDSLFYLVISLALPFNHCELDLPLPHWRSAYLCCLWKCPKKTSHKRDFYHYQLASTDLGILLEWIFYFTFYFYFTVKMYQNPQITLAHLEHLFHLWCDGLQLDGRWFLHCTGEKNLLTRVIGKANMYNMLW